MSPRLRPILVVLAFAVAGCGTDAARAPAGPDLPSGFTALDAPIDPRQQLDVPFGKRSHWLQPWRAYLDTVPAQRLLEAPGIQLNVGAADVARDARRLARAGFRRVRIELGWDQVDPRRPGRLAEPGRVSRTLRAIRRAGLRPLILLNADDGAPGPTARLGLDLALPVVPGSRTATLTPASAAQVQPGRTGIDLGHRAAGLLITDRQGSVVTFARPSPRVLNGTVAASTLFRAPFTAPLTAAGEPHPSFESTLRAWLQYTGAVTRAASSVFGDRFDVEVWNELTLNAGFLDARNYYDPLPPELAGTGDTKAAILARTVAYLRKPARRLRGMGIGDGFANQTPFATPANAPAGLTAIDKHPYPRVLTFPRAAAELLGGAAAVGPGGDPVAWEPDYATFFPEYYLTAIQTETLVRDLSPLTEEFDGDAHGRAVTLPDRRRAQLWITETGLATGGPGEATDPPGDVVFRGSEREHLNEKVVLRTLSAFVNKGVAALFLYGATGDEYGLLPSSGSAPALPALRRFTRAFRARGGRLQHRRTLSLEQVADNHDHVQWPADPASGLPPLYDRDVLAVLPFQVSDRRFAVPVYVMTRDLTRRYGTAPADGVRSTYDLPPELFRLRLGGVDGTRAAVSLLDPITAERAPVRIVGRAHGTLDVELLATDYPRVLMVEEGLQPRR